MKEFYHICLTAHSEVLLRSIEDARIITNSIAMSCLKHKTSILTDSIMSTHLHINAICENPEDFVRATSISICKKFNFLHQREGALFDPKPMIKRIYGPNHCQMALNYSLRQAVHHGIAESPFEYPYGTCMFLFAAQRGGEEIKPVFHGQEIKKFVYRNDTIPNHLEADCNGIILRSSFEEIKLVEHWYGTFKNFMFSMLRQTNQEWLASQASDNNHCPLVTLEQMEQGFTTEEVAQMLKNEGNAKLVRRGINDMEVCRIIDNQLIGNYGVSSVYHLDKKQKQRMACILQNEFGIYNQKQIERCLAMNYVAK